MQLFKLIRKITPTTVKFLLFGFTIALPLEVISSQIGEIVESTGSGQIVREAGNSISLSSTPPIEINDTAETSNGRMLIEFLDKAELSLTEHTKVYIDKVYYDPDPSKSKMTMRMALGTARFASGRLGMVNKNNIDIQTPTASIAVRGTDFTTTIDELGRSLVILLLTNLETHQVQLQSLMMVEKLYLMKRMLLQWFLQWIVHLQDKSQ